MSLWIGVDLDGTLAHYDSKKFPAIGDPIEPMMKRVREWLSIGIEVRIFTARASNSENIVYIQDWLVANGLPMLKVTNAKDEHMWMLFDDRARQVIYNTGIVVEAK